MADVSIDAASVTVLGFGRVQANWSGLYLVVAKHAYIIIKGFDLVSIGNRENIGCVYRSVCRSAY